MNWGGRYHTSYLAPKWSRMDRGGTPRNLGNHFGFWSPMLEFAGIILDFSFRSRISVSNFQNRFPIFNLLLKDRRTLRRDNLFLHKTDRCPQSRRFAAQRTQPNILHHIGNSRRVKRRGWSENDRHVISRRVKQK